jgi:hypothetical protein
MGILSHGLSECKPDESEMAGIMSLFVRIIFGHNDIFGPLRSSPATLDCGIIPYGFITGVKMTTILAMGDEQ